MRKKKVMENRVESFAVGDVFREGEKKEVGGTEVLREP